jgi:hypothetical protein
MANAQTSLVREMAKNKPRIVIVTTGAQSLSFGQTIISTLHRSPDNRHKQSDMILMSVEEAKAELANNPKVSEDTRILLWIRKEQNDPLPTEFANLFPIDPNDNDGSESIIRCEKSQNTNKGLAFAVAIIANDADRMQKLVNLFLNRTANHYSMLPFKASMISHRYALFSDPADEAMVTQWGSNQIASAWDSLKWYPISDRDQLKPADLEECNEVYFIDRSRKSKDMPSPVQSLLKDQNMIETTTLIKKVPGNQPNTSIVLFSAPNNTLLMKKMNSYQTLASIPDGPVVENVLDLRFIGRSSLRVYGPAFTDQEKEVIRGEVAKAMRQDLHMVIEERGDIFKELDKELTFEELQGATDTRKKVRRKIGLRYIWLYQLVDSTGSTSFHSYENCLTTQAPQTYEMTHPDDRDKPFDEYCHCVGGGRADEERRMRPIYERDHAAWLDRKQAWEDRQNEQFETQWERTVTKEETAKAHGILRLIDLQDENGAIHVIWEKDCNGVASNNSSNYKTDRVSVRGVGNKPSSLDTPDSSDDCPANLKRQAAYNGAANALSQLQAEAWLPEVGAVSDSTDKQTDSNNDNADSSGKAQTKSSHPKVSSSLKNDMKPMVVDISGNTVVVTLQKGVLTKVGDIVYPLIEKEIKDPISGKVIETRTVSVAKLRVVHIYQKTADCIPVSSQDIKNLSLIQKGMSIKMLHPSTYNTKKSLKKPNHH